MKTHLKHLAMCAPMIVVGIVLLAAGTSATLALLPVIGCMLMMGLMMWGMAQMGGHGRGGHGAG